MKKAEGGELSQDLMDAPKLQAERPVLQKRREKMQREDLEAALFELFSRQEFWTLKDLENRLEQHSAWIRDILQRLCVYHKKAPNKNHYELKAEYKVRKQEGME